MNTSVHPTVVSGFANVGVVTDADAVAAHVLTTWGRYQGHCCPDEIVVHVGDDRVEEHASPSDARLTRERAWVNVDEVRNFVKLA